MSSLTPEEIVLLKAQFVDLAARSPNQDLIDKHTFLRFLPLPGMLGERLFFVADRARVGGIDLEEFICCVAVLVRGSEEERLKLLYDMYHFSEDAGGIVFQDLLIMINSSVFAPPGDAELHRAAASQALFSPSLSASSSGFLTSPVMEPSSSPSSPMPPLSLNSEDDLLHTEEELSKIDDQIENCTDIHELNTLYQTKHTQEQKLAKQGHDALESYRKTGKTLHRTISKLAQEALESCDKDVTGKLNFEEFKDWIGTHPLIADSLFNNHTVATLSERISLIPSSQFPAKSRPMSPAGDDFEEIQMRGHLYRPGKILKGQLRKYYVLRGEFLYEFKSEKISMLSNPEPSDALFLEGARIFLPDAATVVMNKQIEMIEEALTNLRALEHAEDKPETLAEDIQRLEKHQNDCRAEITKIISKRDIELSLDAPTRFEFQVILSHRRLVLFADTERERAEWVKCLEKSANVRRIEDFYKINFGKHLGKGCFADVYECEELATGQPFAVKIVDKSDLDKAEMQTLSTEISCLNLVHHPNVVSMHDKFEIANKVYIITELLAGGTVVERISKKGKCPPKRAREIMQSILEGLSYLHDAGIVHRDLKPSNIVFTDYSDHAVVKILDFGFSAFSKPQGKFTQAVGTVKYYAPELIKGQAYDAAVDMWCVGIILYILLVGRFPFPGENEAQLSENIENVRSGRDLLVLLSFFPTPHLIMVFFFLPSC